MSKEEFKDFKNANELFCYLDKAVDEWNEINESTADVRLGGIAKFAALQFIKNCESLEEINLCIDDYFFHIKELVYLSLKKVLEAKRGGEIE